MKKLTILGLMISLFAFWGSKNEVNNVKAEEVALQTLGETSATFFEHSDTRYLTYKSTDTNVPSGELYSYKDSIVSLILSNSASDIPTTYIECIMIRDCTYTDASGVTTTPADGVIFAYVSEATGSTAEISRHNCVLFADVDKIYANSDARRMFLGFSYLETIDISMLDTSKTTDMSRMFSECSSLKEIDLSGFNTSNVTSMHGMFQNCQSLRSIDVSHLNTSNVIDMNWMFGLCTSLTKLDLSSMNTSKLEWMNSMFANCTSLVEIDLSSFDTRKTQFMANMFARCASLKSLNLSNFDFSSIEMVNGMFYKCESLKKLDLSSLDFSSLKDTIAINNLISDLTGLEFIKSPEFLPLDASTNPDHVITLPTQFVEYYGITELNANNISTYPVLNLAADKFIREWRTLRTEGGDNGICAALSSNSKENPKLKQLLLSYDGFDEETKNTINATIDKEDVTIGESIQYIKNFLSINQTIEETYDYSKEDSGSFMTISITEESPYLIAVISIIGVLSVIGYYFYNKKKQTI